ncbi:hypothetical protein H072_1282 [Dactylellina haptotyla CBS 200.50]|uniref:Condensation domain-containing protein n=1 Tax=Dactylellina haptotyla (strain CBS 200.50) TaxID=1284197 RepID=S8AP57_DACHA|nr:hypothetical protein H072_1282 [Dactylellina haptotyla CBS 200.50]
MQSNQISSRSPQLERQLGFYEKFRIVLHDLGYYNNVSIIARYSHGVERLRSWPNAIFHAFCHAIQEHPALGVTVTRDEKQDLYFQRLGSVNLEQVVKFEEIPGDQKEQERRLIALSAEENNRGFDKTPGKPMWRAVVLTPSGRSDSHSFHIAFFWHHVIGDGRSGLAVHQSLLEGLASFGRELDCRTNRPSDDIDITRIPVSTKAFFISMEQALPNVSVPPPTPPISDCEKWTGGTFNFRQPTVTQLADIRLPADVVRHVVETCRKHNTTVTALLQAVMGKAVLANVSLDRIRTAVAVSLRRFFTPPVDDSVMGLWISVYTTEYHRSQFDQKSKASAATLLWQRSQENTAQINRVIADGGKHVEIMSLMAVDDYESAVKSRADQPRDNSFGLTNLGVFKSPPQTSGLKELAIDDMVFSQSAHANGAAFTICVVSVQGGDMNMVFNYQEGVVSQEKMTAIVDTVQKCLLDLSSDGVGRV